MSFRVWTVYEVACDVCDEVHDSTSDSYSEAEALLSAQQNGWPITGDEIRCPHCPAHPAINYPASSLRDRTPPLGLIGRRIARRPT
ncbi:hypothetical protein AB0M95_40265 [Sphaerisporangium sp. NPDC051017]|uniref:hypothetical protein n=1 Tax=Sphaerisporangium sp. NPDC051017 TaxID=3154636 RepID=UPI00343D4365